ncbi:alpha-1-antichymotrypsin-like [Microcebus murinus]|uniref:alpha-1-antichymotrypsin-like n=1 Tax=Microcebus murinus TaxID=30608 RepID=UPI003F6A8CC4
MAPTIFCAAERDIVCWGPFMRERKTQKSGDGDKKAPQETSSKHYQGSSVGWRPQCHLPVQDCGFQISISPRGQPVDSRRRSAIHQLQPLPEAEVVHNRTPAGAITERREWRVQKMLPLLALGLLVAGVCPAVLCHQGGTRDQESVTLGDHDNGTRGDSLRLGSSNTDFACSLYKKLALQNPNENVIFSPLSVSVALAFLSLGAGGTTLTELLQGLKFNLTETSEAEIHQSFQQLLRSLSRPSEQLQLSTGNAMFIAEQLRLRERFVEDAQGLYASKAFKTNFQDSAAAEKFINDYVEKKTRGKIVDLVKDLDPSTMMVLVNYIFFKAKWNTPFDPHDTVKARFYLSRRKWVKVPMMSMEDLDVPYFRDEELSCAVAELMYTGNASALLVLPDLGKMKQVEAKLLPETLRRWRDSLQTRHIDSLQLPKFSISGDYNLENILPRLGIRAVFTKEADLSGITGAKNLLLSQMVHKAVLDVAEVGTEAAAATGIKMVPMSGRMGPMFTFSVTRPFMVIIQDKKLQHIPFMAKVTELKEA